MDRVSAIKIYYIIIIMQTYTAIDKFTILEKLIMLEIVLYCNHRIMIDHNVTYFPCIV